MTRPTTPPCGLHLIDASATVGRWPQMYDTLVNAADVIAELDRTGIAAALVADSLGAVNNPAAGNERIARVTIGHPRLLPVWTVLPPTTGELPAPSTLIDTARQQGVAAARGYPAQHGYPLADRSFGPVLDALAGAGIPLLVRLPDTTVSDVSTVCAEHRGLTVIVTELGYRRLRDVAPLLDRHERLLVDLGGFSSHGGIEWLAGTFGVDRLVFGTGMPIHDPAEAVTNLLWSGLDDDAVRAVGGDNLRSVLPTWIGLPDRPVVGQVP